MFRLFYLITLLFLIIFNINAFELPIDLFSINYETFSKGKKPTLHEGRLVFSAQYEYYDLQINYIVSFDKKDKNNVFVFFEKPSSNDTNFKEFYKDTIAYYQERSLFIYSYLSYDPEYIEKDDDFILINGKITIYIKTNQQKGLYGFGINLERHDTLIDKESLFLNTTDFWNMDKPELKDIKKYDPYQFSNRIYFIDINLIPFVKEKELILEPDENGVFIYQILLKIEAPKKYKININNLKNFEYLFVEYNSMVANQKEYINESSKEITISSENDIAKLIFWGKIKEIKDKETKISMKLIE
jgi:hypothetical protein